MRARMSVLSEQQNGRLAATKEEELAEAENRIHRASRDTIESLRIIGRELNRIKDEALYEVMGKHDFKEYVTDHLRMDFRQASMFMRASLALDRLESEKLQLPYNQSQAIELAKLRKPEVQVGVWRKVLDFCDKEHAVATFRLVRDAVYAQRTKGGQVKRRVRAKKENPGIDIDLGDDVQVTIKSVWSDVGERALNRIRRLCGDHIADAVDSQNPKLSEKDLLKWADEEDEMVKNLSYWIVMKRWSLRKSLAYEANLVSNETTVAQLSDLAHSRGGKAFIEYAGVSITIEVSKNVKSP